jgi:hypothetical protein
MWVVTSLNGHAQLLIADVDVNVAIGDGLYVKNMCFGHRPDEQVLRSVGLTCDGIKQTDHCDEDDLSNKFEQHCEDFYLLEGMESIAIFCAFAANLLIALSRVCQAQPLLRSCFRVASVVMLFMSLGTAVTVIRLVKESDMVDEESFSCSNILGLELCHGYGASMYLQGFAVAELVFAVVAGILLIFISYPSLTTTTYGLVRVPLLRPVVYAEPANNMQSQYVSNNIQIAAEAV